MPIFKIYVDTSFVSHEDEWDTGQEHTQAEWEAMSEEDRHRYMSEVVTSFTNKHIRAGYLEKE